MRYTIIGTVLLFVTVIIVSVFYFKNIDKDKLNGNSSLQFIPNDSFLISLFSLDQSTESLFKDFEIYEAMLGKKNFQVFKNLKLDLLDQIITTEQSKNDVVLSLHAIQDTIQFLFSTSNQGIIKQKDFITLVDKGLKNWNAQKLDTLTSTTIEITDSASLKNYFLSFKENHFFLSSSLPLLIKTLSEKNEKLGTEEIEFIKEHRTPKSHVSFFIRNSNIAKINSFLSRQKSGLLTNLLDSLEGYSFWNQNYRSDALILVGTSSIHKKDTYLSLFKTQHKVDQPLSIFFPYNTALYLELSLSDKNIFQKELYQWQSKNGSRNYIDNQRDQLEKEHNIDLESDFNSFLGNNFAVVEQSNGEFLGFLSLKDSDAFIEKATPLFTTTSDSLLRFNFPNLLSTFYGEPFDVFSRPYATIINGTLIVANQLTTLKEYLISRQNNRNLNGSIEFKNFEKVQSKESNITFFAHGAQNKNLLRKNLKNDVYQVYSDKKNYGYKDFSAWSIQLSGNDIGFHSSVYGVYKNEDALGLNAEWEYPLRNKPITPPWVFEHSDTSKFIFLQEQDHTAHAISPEGEKIWSTVIHGRIVGETLQLSDRSLLLLTDKNRLYRFTPDGKLTSGFSLLLPDRPTQGPTIMYSGQDTIIGITTKKRALFYSLEGKEFSKWKNIDIDNECPISLFKQQENLIIGTQEGSLFEFSTNGQLIKKSKPNHSIEILYGFYPSNLLTNSLDLIAIDTAGTIWQYNEQRVSAINQIQGFKADQIFHYNPDLQKAMRINENGLELLSLLDTSNHQQVGLTLPKIDNTQWFSESNQHFLGITSAQNRLLYVFTESGSLLNGFPIAGTFRFYYGQINYNSGNYVLCYRNNHKLYAFKDNNN